MPVGQVNSSSAIVGSLVAQQRGPNNTGLASTPSRSLQVGGPSNAEVKPLSPEAAKPQFTPDAIPKATPPVQEQAPTDGPKFSTGLSSSTPFAPPAPDLLQSSGNSLAPAQPITTYNARGALDQASSEESGKRLSLVA